MKNVKSPEQNGFTVELYTVFWNEIKYSRLNSINEGLTTGMFSVVSDKV